MKNSLVTLSLSKGDFAITFKKLVVAAAIALTILPLLIHPHAFVAGGRATLFTRAWTLPWLGVYILLVMSAAYGIARKGNALLVVLFAGALVASIFDARTAPVFAIVAAVLLLRRPA